MSQKGVILAVWTHAWGPPLVGHPPTHAWGPPSVRVGDPPTFLAFFFFPRLPHTPPRATWDFFGPPTIPHPPPRATWDFFPECTPNLATKGAFRPLLAVKFVPWQATAPWRSVSCACVGREEHWHQSAPCRKVSLGQTAHWHSEHTLQKDHIDRHIALRAV